MVSGATGWVGRSALHALQRRMTPDEFMQRVRAFASRSSTLPTTAYPDQLQLKIPVYPLSDLPDLAMSGRISAFFHAAFLTRDRLGSMEKERYVAINRGITAQVLRALELAPAARVVVVSSGAAAVHASCSDPERSLLDDPYGVLKLEEERLLARNRSALVLRIYALSGRFIRDPARFALGDFLLKAQQRLPIRINSPAPVWRSYGNAGDITALAWAWLLSAEPPALGQLDAVTHHVSLEQLAESVCRIYRLPPVISRLDTTAPAQSYGADTEPFLAALTRFDQNPHSLEEQIIDTGVGLGLAAPPWPENGRPTPLSCSPLRIDL
ncbi:NAD-dependent epimerase/dehydratase family protein [Synechococcus sp. BSF8S]|uniref:NAD-dependent epimerase/dehydratase family protein n=1 Tax=Synechococcales TaxID=1890424 RepID=UPI00351C5523